jgi:HK97 gp10 family phage protein
MMATKLQGTDDVLRKMRALPVKLQKKALNASLRKGAAIVKKAAVARAQRFDDPHTPMKVYKEIVVRTNAKAGLRAGGAMVQVGVMGGAKRYKNTKENRRKKRVGGSYEGPGNVYYWRFLEFGTAKMKAQPFMRPALADNADSAISAIVSELNAQLDKMVPTL